MNARLTDSLQKLLGSRCVARPDGRLALSPADEAELRVIVSHFHTSGEPLRESAVLLRRAMRQLGKVQVKSATIEAQPGATLQEIDRAAADHGLWIGPLSPRMRTLELGHFLEGPDAGLRAVLGGRLEPIALGLEAVLTSGLTYRSKPAPRSAAGPDLDALLFGGEGRFGWISRATVRLLPKPGPAGRASYSFPTTRALGHAMRRILSAGCAVSHAQAQRRGDRAVIELELYGSPEAIERDLSTCSHFAAESGGRASGQAVQPATASGERELAWAEVEAELEAGQALALHRLSSEAVIAEGATRGRALSAGQPWAEAGTFATLAQAAVALPEIGGEG